MAVLLLGTGAGCFSMRGSSGGGEAEFERPRRIDPADVALPAGYSIDAVAQGLTFPTGVTLDDEGRIYVVEAGYSYGGEWTTPRLLRIEPGGNTTEIARGSNPPWNGVAFHDGAFFIAEGGHRDGGRILRIDMDGKATVLVDKLPSLGDHHTNGPAIGPDGAVYFGQGTATNSGVVGVDNYKFGWLERHPDFHDVPAKDITLAGVNFETANPLTPDRKDRAVTGAYVPFGVKTRKGQVIPGAIPCSGAIMKVPAGGGEPELVAWGLRNPYGLTFSPAGKLYVTENSFDVRGSRPVFGTGDLLWAIEPGTWYGWPDFFAGEPLESKRFAPPEGSPPPRLLAEHPGAAPTPLAKLGVHSSSNGLDIAPAAFGYAGEIFIAQFGDMAPQVGKVVAPVGYQVVHVHPDTGVIATFAANKGKKRGPASLLDSGGFERPTDVKFTPDGDAMYVVDFGVMTIGKNGPQPRQRTGVLWRITREESR